MTRAPLALALAASAALSGCTLAPRYERAPSPPSPQVWSAVTPQAGTATSAEGLGWREVFPDPRLQQVIALALDNNRDLRVAVLNIDAARAQYRIQRAGLVPGVAAVGSLARTRTPAAVAGTAQPVEADVYGADLAVSAFELDLFGRVRSLTEASRQDFLATEADWRAARISLIAETANAWLTLAADQDLLEIARSTLETRQATAEVVNKRFEAGAASQVEVRQAQILVEQSRGDVAQAAARVAQDRNALRLLLGTDLPADLAAADVASVAILADLPAGAPSAVLLSRPDVLAAEHRLRGANADIGAARAAFLPQISLTGSTGHSSPELSSLFDAGAGAWSFTPRISLPIFAGGANLAGLRAATAGRDIALATYEKAIQSGFREVSDALAVRETIDERLQARTRELAAAEDAERLARLRYERGVDDYLSLLDAQRTLYASQQAMIALRLERASNLATLYKALGGGGDPAAD
ncbi:MAG: efflux transporter outer membrane subunit [Phenylobacterium sp.]|uniref:efflux transporter outer membrane subunit n=1 Tax=Phenylobacterium sp. TaxID=1871053 RepID=UPI00391A2DED